MGILYSRCELCSSRCSEDNHLVRVISYDKRHDQIFCVNCFIDMRLAYINSKNLENYIDYINKRDDRKS